MIKNKLTYQEQVDKLNSINYDLQLIDIQNLFVDLTDYNAIRFTEYSRQYYKTNTYNITYPIINGESDYYKPIKTPAELMSYRLYIRLEILRDEYRDEYLKIRNELTNPIITDIIGHQYIQLNSSFIKYPSGGFSTSNTDILEFWPKQSLWL
jgi:hypothetical protein